MRIIKIKVVDCLDIPSEEMFLVQILSKYYIVEISNAPEFLIFSCWGIEHLHKKYEKCIKIFYTNENVSPNFNECDYAIGFDRISFGKRYLRKGYGIRGSEIGFENYPSIRKERKADRSLLKRKFCNFIFSNRDHGEGAILREQFCRELSKYKKVDCPGRVLNNMSSERLIPRYGKNDLESKLEFIKDYKFTIAFENSASDDYITEKIIHPFIAESIPIYWGGRNVGIDFNEDSFINCNFCGTDIQKMVELVKKVDEDDELYLSMVQQKPFQSSYRFNEKEDMISFLLNIIENGKRFNKDSRNYEEVLRTAALSGKYQKLYALSIQWLEIKQSGKSITCYFIERDLKKVAIYGAGHLGICLFDELADGGIQVEYFIDKIKEGEIEGVPIYGIDRNYPDVDAIIVTAVTDFDEIKRESSQINIPMISLEEVLADRYFKK